jgi:hypothetical protein
VLLQGLAMGLRGNREDGVENMFVESPWWILALKTTFCKIVHDCLILLIVEFSI